MDLIAAARNEPDVVLRALRGQARDRGVGPGDPEYPHLADAYAHLAENPDTPLVSGARRIVAQHALYEARRTGARPAGWGLFACFALALGF